MLPRTTKPIQLKNINNCFLNLPSPFLLLLSVYDTHAQPVINQTDKNETRLSSFSSSSSSSAALTITINTYALVSRTLYFYSFVDVNSSVCVCVCVCIGPRPITARARKYVEVYGRHYADSVRYVLGWRRPRRCLVGCRRCTALGWRGIPASIVADCTLAEKRSGSAAIDTNCT